MQFVHVALLVAAATADIVPDPHDRHVVDDDAPVSDEYVPVMQLVHPTDDVDPASDEYFPAAQFVQAVAPVNDE